MVLISIATECVVWCGVVCGGVVWCVVVWCGVVWCGVSVCLLVCVHVIYSRTIFPVANVIVDCTTLNKNHLILFHLINYVTKIFLRIPLKDMTPGKYCPQTHVGGEAFYIKIYRHDIKQSICLFRE